MKKLLCAALILTLAVLTCTPALAAGINSNEQSVLGQMRTPANMNGNMVYVPASYVNQAEAHFNTIDMTSEQAGKINSLISQGRSFLESTGKSSMGELSGAEKKTILQYASAAAGVLNLTAAGGSDTSRVKIIDKNGQVILDDSGAVIKTTGAERGFSPADAFAAAAGLLAAVCCAGVIFVKAGKKSV